VTVVSEHVRALRLRAIELRRVADALVCQAHQLEVGLSERPLIGGRDLVNVAVTILQMGAAVGPRSRGMHYRDLLAQIERHTGKSVRGIDSAATLLANLDRDPRVESAQSRSGRYRLTGHDV
jgi:hypothetical protein